MTKETTTLLIKGKVVKEFLGEQRNVKSFVNEIRNSPSISSKSR